MESILVNSSSPPQPVTSDYDETTATQSDEHGSNKQQDPSNTPSREVRAAAQEVVEIIYDELQEQHPISDSSKRETPKPANSAAVPSPDHFKDYSDDELEVMAMALSKTLRQRQDYTGETSQNSTAEPKLRFVNEPRQRYARRAERLAHARNISGRLDNLKLDTILETKVSRDAEVEDDPGSEVPPPIPVKKRRHLPPVHTSPNIEDVKNTATEGRTSEGIKS